MYAKLTDLAVLENNEIRVLEQTRLSRLMYSCRNPHRRAECFLRLEHVRRLLSQTNAHFTWYFMDSSERIPRRRSDRVSVKDLRKLVSLMELVELLVQQTILKAAYRLTTELIARGQFEALATTLAALLARMFILKRPIFFDLKAAVTKAHFVVVPAPRCRN